MKTLLLTLSLMTLNSAFAHDGHNHGPGQVQPTKGGVILKAESFFLEVVGSNKEIKFYPLKQVDPKSMMLKPIPQKDFKLSATFSLPRSKKVETISLKPVADYFLGTLDAKNSHRYQVDVTIDYMGENEKMTYQIEPQE